jgi:thiamine pyrophosphate-dependent acetolactate synthase large subunit-like protein
LVSKPVSTREDYYRVLADILPEEALVVTSLGNASYLWACLRDRPENFYVEDAMGLALPVALGLAAAQPDRKVVGVEGDGGLLMHLGTLVTVGAVAPKNLTVLLMQNGVHAASGGQALTNPNLDLADLARSAGWKHAENVSSSQDFEPVFLSAFAGEGPSLLALTLEPDIPVVEPPIPLNPIVIKQRFMEALGVPRYVSSAFGKGRLVEATSTEATSGRMPPEAS